MCGEKCLIKSANHEFEVRELSKMSGSCKLFESFNKHVMINSLFALFICKLNYADSRKNEMFEIKIEFNQSNWLNSDISEN